MDKVVEAILQTGGPGLLVIIILVLGFPFALAGAIGIWGWKKGLIGAKNGKPDPFQQLGSKIEKCSEEIKDEIAKNGQNVEILFGQIRDNRNSLEQVVKFTDKSEIPSRDYFERLEKMIYKQTLLFEELLRKLE